MKKLITALSLIAIILIISACSPAGGNAPDNPPGTLDSGEEIVTLNLLEDGAMSFEGSLEILKQKDPNAAVIEFKADKESVAQKDNKFAIYAIGDINGEAGVIAVKEPDDPDKKTNV